MSVEHLLDQLDEMVDNAATLPLSNKILIDGEKLRRLLEDIRLDMPKDVQSARAIVTDRTSIIDNARKEAEGIVRQAEERARAMIAKDAITQQAQEKANDLLAQTRVKAGEIRKAANEYVDDLMKRTDESIALSLSELRKARQSIKSSQRIGSGDK